MADRSQPNWWVSEAYRNERKVLDALKEFGFYGSEVIDNADQMLLRVVPTISTPLDEQDVLLYDSAKDQLYWRGPSFLDGDFSYVVLEEAVSHIKAIYGKVAEEEASRHMALFFRRLDSEPFQKLKTP